MSTETNPLSMTSEFGENPEMFQSWLKEALVAGGVCNEGGAQIPSKFGGLIEAVVFTVDFFS